jgi:hypothetical protein
MGDGLKRRTRIAGVGRLFLFGAGVLVAAPPVACSSSGGAKEASAPPGYEGAKSLVPRACGKDQVREYRCDALLPLSSALPAPEPYDACPGVIDVVDPIFVPLEKAAEFDAVHTEFMRKRAPPGHQCCYSWCARLDVADASEVPPNGRCGEPLAFAEKICMPEPEGRISKAYAAAPFDRCAEAVRPPQGASFSVPKAALLSPNLTTERRNLGFAECCYGWCSIAPPGSGLERKF